MKLILLCHGATTAMRVGGFPSVDDRIDEAARRKLTNVRMTARMVVSSPTWAARETVEALGLTASAMSALGDIDYGLWSGKTFAEVQVECPDALGDWLEKPWEGTPDGETFAAACERVDEWMKTIGEEPASLLAVVSPMIVRAVLAVAIDLPAPTTMRIDIAPLTTATLSRHRGWRLQQLGAAPGD